MRTEPDEGPAVGEVLGEVIARLGWAGEPQSVPDHLDLVRVTATVEAQARVALVNAVQSARSAGATWSAIGRVLGMSKQAAQQRFSATPDASGGPLAPDERILGPISTFEEMDELNLAGKYGWHSVEAGPNFHRVQRSLTQWEHARIALITRARRTAMQADGWQVIHSGFPYTYLKRDREIPALCEAPAHS